MVVARLPRRGRYAVRATRRSRGRRRRCRGKDSEPLRRKIHSNGELCLQTQRADRVTRRSATTAAACFCVYSPRRRTMCLAAGVSAGASAAGLQNMIVCSFLQLCFRCGGMVVSRATERSPPETLSALSTEAGALPRNSTANPTSGVCAMRLATAPKTCQMLFARISRCLRRG